MPESLVKFLPLMAPLAGVAAVYALCLGLLLWQARRQARAPGTLKPFWRQLLALVLTALFLALAVMALPVSVETRGQLLTLLGLALTALLTLSSASFASNAMAGMLMRNVRPFRTGDFIRIEEYFGRVTERGLFHTEIQTEDRDLCTLPNAWLASRPVTVLRSSGSVVSATVSIGYDVSHSRLEPLLREAAEEAGLEEPFVQILELGDHAVKYRAAGLLTEVKGLLTARSRLRQCILDRLHGDGIEIVSPAFMNQRRLDPDAPVRPRRRPTPETAAAEDAPEKVLFDKADAAERREMWARRHTELLEKLDALKKARDKAPEDEIDRLDLDIEAVERKARAIARALERDETSKHDDKSP